jgi:hypothetical protein
MRLDYPEQYDQIKIDEQPVHPDRRSSRRRAQVHQLGWVAGVVIMPTMAGQIFPANLGFRLALGHGSMNPEPEENLDVFRSNPRLEENLSDGLEETSHWSGPAEIIGDQQYALALQRTRGQWPGAQWLGQSLPTKRFGLRPGRSEFGAKVPKIRHPLGNETASFPLPHGSSMGMTFPWPSMNY